MFDKLEMDKLMKGSTTLIENGDFVPASELALGDVTFTQLPDANDNTSYNYLWTMNPKAVGTINPETGVETFTITVKFVDKTAAKVYGDIFMDFIVDVKLPTPQTFAYQGSFWQNGVGEGTFNVNPLVYNSDTHDSSLKGASNIQTDLVNGYINTTTQLKPANLGELVSNLEGCGDVNFVFDADRFGSFAHLSGFVTDRDGTQLFSTVGHAETQNYATTTTVKEYASSISNVFTANNASALIKLHEIDAENATPAAKRLVGKDVPVKLVVTYNEYNKVALQSFDVHFIDPLKIDGMIDGVFVDAVINGSFVNVETGFTFTDWNEYSVAKTTVTNPTEKQKWASQLYEYYAVDKVTFDTDNVKSSLRLVGDTYQHVEGETNGNLPYDSSLKQVDDNGNVVPSDPTQLVYYNADGTPVGVDFSLFIDVSVDYKWGTLSKKALKANVLKAGGTPNVIGN